jgi:hypothetical protein
MVLLADSLGIHLASRSIGKEGQRILPCHHQEVQRLPVPDRYGPGKRC